MGFRTAWLRVRQLFQSDLFLRRLLKVAVDFRLLARDDLDLDVLNIILLMVGLALRKVQLELRLP